MLNPTNQKPHIVILPIECWFWRGSSGEPMSLPIGKCELKVTLDTFDETDVVVLNRAKIATINEYELSMDVNGVSAQLLSGFLQMTGSANGIDLYHEDDIAISSGVGALTGSPIDNKTIFVQDENGLYLDYLASGTPSLGEFKVAGTVLTVNSAIDGVNYTAKYVADDSSSTDSTRYTRDFTKMPTRQFSMHIYGNAINPATGEPIIDDSDADKYSVDGVYLDKVSIHSDIPLFQAGNEDQMFSLTASVRERAPDDIKIYKTNLTASPTS